MNDFVKTKLKFKNELHNTYIKMVVRIIIMICFKKQYMKFLKLLTKGKRNSIKIYPQSETILVLVAKHIGPY